MGRPAGFAAASSPPIVDVANQIFLKNSVGKEKKLLGNRIELKNHIKMS